MRIMNLIVMLISAIISALPSCAKIKWIDLSFLSKYEKSVGCRPHTTGLSSLVVYGVYRTFSGFSKAKVSAVTPTRMRRSLSEVLGNRNGLYNTEYEGVPEALPPRRVRFYRTGGTILLG